MTHYNVQVHIQEVHEAEPVRENGGHVVKLSGGVGGGQKIAMSEKRTVALLEAKVSAPTEAEAYERIMAILVANQPRVLPNEDLPPVIRPRA